MNLDKIDSIQIKGLYITGCGKPIKEIVVLANGKHNVNNIPDDTKKVANAIGGYFEEIRFPINITIRAEKSGGFWRWLASILFCGLIRYEESITERVEVTYSDPKHLSKKTPSYSNKAALIEEVKDALRSIQFKQANPGESKSDEEVKEGLKRSDNHSINRYTGQLSQGTQPACTACALSFATRFADGLFAEGVGSKSIEKQIDDSVTEGKSNHRKVVKNINDFTTVSHYLDNDHSCISNPKYNPYSHVMFGFNDLYPELFDVLEARLEQSGKKYLGGVITIRPSSYGFGIEITPNGEMIYSFYDSHPSSGATLHQYHSRSDFTQFLNTRLGSASPEQIQVSSLNPSK